MPSPPLPLPLERGKETMYRYQRQITHLLWTEFLPFEYPATLWNAGFHLLSTEVREESRKLISAQGIRRLKNVLPDF